MCQAEKGPELTAPAAPEASEPETELLAEAKAAGLFLDRELSWLQFNRRVLEQAGDPTVPLLERLKFLGIYRSNLEEFFMVRVGSLTHRAALLPDERDEKTGCTPGEQVSAILAAVAAQQPREERIYRRLLEDMRDAGIDVLDFHKMTKPEEVVAKKYFSELRPLLSPRVVDGGHPFPFIANREIYVAATIGKGDDFRLGLVSLLRLPPWRVVELDGRQKVVLTAELVRHFVPQLFKKQEVRDAVLLQVTRNADVFIYVGGESDAWVKTVLDGVDNPNLRVVTLMDCVELLDEETVEGMQTEKHDHEADGTEPDEHVWTSPRNAARICQKLSDTFAAADSAHAAAYAQRCGDYVEKLDQLDAEFQDVVAHAARKTMVFADRFPLRYFAEAYGLDYYAAYPGCADAAEPSAATVAFLIDKVRAENIPVVFTIELSNGKLADTICEATGAKKLEFATCHNVTAQAFADGATYLQLMERNVQALREALN